ncbi:tetratricopeptide repeat protein [Moheibacter lacus]|uniref:Lipoprotein n=1 Tax=Moheibacter lacus TaxID=2745851 RepID=A0A838ZSA6_9FLAO|nr:hypothetical protein [Moheibacter lacus]MBA5629219.1 hypothetical protein [Moheibacter lacus]
MRIVKAIQFVCFGLFLIVSSCQKRQNEQICREKFFASYFTLSTMPSYSYDKYNNIPLNMPDSAKIYINCMIRLSPDNYENYIWQAKTYFILKEYDSLIYSMKNTPTPIDHDFNYAFESLTGIGYEKIDMGDSANLHYRKALDIIEKTKDKIPMDYAFTKYLIENNNANFKIQLEKVIKDFQQRNPNDSMYNIYLREVQKIPFEQGREFIISDIVKRYDKLFYQTPN